MVEPLGLGSGEHEVKLGSSFDPGSGVGFHSIRYDFKPASVDTKRMASLNIAEGNSVNVTVPHIEGSGTTHTVYKGNKRPIQKECVLIIDHQTGEITLEKLSNAIQLKKTRAEGSSKASQQAARPLTPSEQLKQMKTSSSPSKKSKKSHPQSQQAAKKEPTAAAPPPPVAQPPPTASPVRHMSSESESGEASTSDSSDDEKPTKSSPAKDVLSMPTCFEPPLPPPPPPPPQPRHNDASRSHAQGRSRYVSMLSEDLRLSESGSDSD